MHVLVLCQASRFITGPFDHMSNYKEPHRAILLARILAQIDDLLLQLWCAGQAARSTNISRKPSEEGRTDSPGHKKSELCAGGRVAPVLEARAVALPQNDSPAALD